MPLSAVCLRRQCSSAQHLKKMRRKKNPNLTPKTRREMQTDHSYYAEPRALWSISKTRSQVTFLSEVHPHFWWTKSHRVLVCSHLYLSGVHLQLFGNQILRSFCTSQAADLSFLPFSLPVFQILIQFSLLCFSAPLVRGYMLFGLGTCNTDTWKQILCQKNVWRETVSMGSTAFLLLHSPDLSSLLSSSLADSTALICRWSSRAMQSTTA